jgi:hypothetical protein
MRGRAGGWGRLQDVCTSSSERRNSYQASHSGVERKGVWEKHPAGLEVLELLIGSNPGTFPGTAG